MLPKRWNRPFWRRWCCLAVGLLVSCGGAKGGATAAASGGSTTGGTSGGTAGPAGPAMSSNLNASSKAADIMSVDTAGRTVTLKLVGAETDEANGFNFNGYSNGKMVIQVPTGWTVKGTFTSNSETRTAPWSSVGPAHGAHLHRGLPQRDHPPMPRPASRREPPPRSSASRQTRRAGYALVCGVPGHTTGGMWDEIDVVDGLVAPQVRERP